MPHRTCTFRLVIGLDAGGRVPQDSAVCSCLGPPPPSRLADCLVRPVRSSALTREQFLPSSRHPLAARVWPGPRKPEDTLAGEKVGNCHDRLRVEFMNGRSPDYLQLRNNIRKYHIRLAAMTVPGEGRYLEAIAAMRPSLY